MDLENSNFDLTSINFKAKRLIDLIENRFNAICLNRFKHRYYYRIYELMYILARSKNYTLRISKLAQIRRVSPQSLLKPMQRMIALGLITRKMESLADRRYRELTLTDQGAFRLAQLDKIMLDIKAEFIPVNEHKIYCVVHQALISTLVNIDKD